MLSDKLALKNRPPAAFCFFGRRKARPPFPAAASSPPRNYCVTVCQVQCLSPVFLRHTVHFSPSIQGNLPEKAEKSRNWGLTMLKGRAIMQPIKYKPIEEREVEGHPPVTESRRCWECGIGDLSNGLSEGLVKRAFASVDGTGRRPVIRLHRMLVRGKRAEWPR